MFVVFSWNVSDLNITVVDDVDITNTPVLDERAVTSLLTVPLSGCSVMFTANPVEVVSAEWVPDWRYRMIVLDVLYLCAYAVLIIEQGRSCHPHVL